MTDFDLADLNGDGVIDRQEYAEIIADKLRREIADADAKRDQIRKMVWFALFGMLLYPLFVFGTEALGFSSASEIIGSIAPTYYVSTSMIVAAFFGADAYMNGRNKKEEKDG
jgi:hypothetical protein